MKILMICTEKLPVPPVLGGAIQTYISGILPDLSKFHEITVLGTSDPSLPDEETIDGIHYVRVPGKIFEIYREGVVRYIESNNSFDLIHIFNRPRLVIPVRKVAPHSKITLSMHNDMFNVEKIDPEEATAALEEVSSIVTVSDYVGNVIRQLYPQAASKIRTIYSGVDTERFLPGSHPNMQEIRHELRKAYGLENKTVILYAGRLSRNKGVDKLVQALPELSKKFKDLALVIVGSNWFSQNHITDYVAYVRALAKKLPVPVITTGFVVPDKIQYWFAAADLFVCTSQWQEPLARVHYEAMAAGLPIVTTARGGNPEVIQLGENGFVVENPEDPRNFAEKISQILSDKSLMKRMGEKGRELAISQYQWNRVASELLEVWTQAINTTSTSVIEQDGTEQISTDEINNTTVEVPDNVIAIPTTQVDEKGVIQQDRTEQMGTDEINTTEEKELENVVAINSPTTEEDEIEVMEQDRTEQMGTDEVNTTEVKELENVVAINYSMTEEDEIEVMEQDRNEQMGTDEMNTTEEKELENVVAIKYTMVEVDEEAVRRCIWYSNIYDGWKYAR